MVSLKPSGSGTVGLTFEGTSFEMEHSINTIVCLVFANAMYDGTVHMVMIALSECRCKYFHISWCIFYLATLLLVPPFLQYVRYFLFYVLADRRSDKDLDVCQNQNKRQPLLSGCLVNEDVI